MYIISMKLKNIPVGSLVRIDTERRHSVFLGQIGVVLCFDHFGTINAHGRGDPVVLWPRHGKKRMARSGLDVLSRPEVKE